MYEIPKGLTFKIGAIGMNLLFVFFAVLFAVAAVQNIALLMIDRPPVGSGSATQAPSYRSSPDAR